MARDRRATPETCPLCGKDVIPAEVELESGVAWGAHHHAHALCVRERLAARVAVLDRQVARLAESCGPPPEGAPRA